MRNTLHSRISNLRSRKAQGGFSLIELAIVIAIVAILLFLVYQRLSKVQNSRIAGDEASNYTQMSTDVRTRFGSQGDFSGLTPKVLIDNGIVPQAEVSGATIQTSWNTTVAVAPAQFTVANDAFAMTYTVPREQCSDFVTAAAPAAARVTVDATVVKNVPGSVNTINMATLGTACDASTGGTVAVKLEQGR